MEEVGEVKEGLTELRTSIVEEVKREIREAVTEMLVNFNKEVRCLNVVGGFAANIEGDNVITGAAIANHDSGFERKLELCARHDHSRRPYNPMATNSL